MSQDYFNQNLRGRSFKGQNLIGANFTYADIRGTDFTNAILRRADFTSAKAGLSLRSSIALVIVSLILAIILGFTAGIFGIFAGIMFSPEYTSKYTIFPALSVLATFLVLSTTTIFRGIVAPLVFLAVVLFVLVISGYVGIFAFQGALAVVGASTYFVVSFIFGGFAFTLAGILQGALLVAIAVIVAVIVAAFFIIAVTTASIAAGIGTHLIFAAAAGGAPIAAVGAIVSLMLSSYVAWRALASDEKYAFLRKLSIAVATFDGTSFRYAILIDANFTEATLKGTDFRKANVTCTCWRNAKQIDQIRPGNTYLQDAKLRQLVITGDGQEKNFDRLDLRGVNLSQAKLQNASFIDADFHEANLQGANLSRAILVRTNFERADLRGASLTGSCIQDWVITESTKLNGISCDYVYLKWVNEDKRDQMPPRGQFTEDGFVTFVRYILETVELYHEKDINPRLALTVLHKMSRDYDESLDIVALGKRGERVFIQVKVSENIIRGNFKEDYYSRYNQDLKLWSGSNHKLPPTVNNFIEKRIREIASETTDDFVFVDATYVEGNYIQTYQGEVNVTGDHTINMGSGNYIERIQGNYVQGNYYAAGQPQSIAQAAAEIQLLLKQLEQTYPANTTSQQMVIAAEAVHCIESNPLLKQRVINAIKSGGLAAFEKAIDNPAGAFIVGAIKGWQEVEAKD